MSSATLIRPRESLQHSLAWEVRAAGQSRTRHPLPVSARAVMCRDGAVDVPLLRAHEDRCDRCSWHLTNRCRQPASS